MTRPPNSSTIGLVAATDRALDRWRPGTTVEIRRELKALTVNPVAPQSHRLDSTALRAAIAAAVGDVPVMDVREAA